uniref:Uncharacterized protein n=1 Tax=Aegilops tauschii subsp. strangulata TaxID=200361 RepID=A0A453AS17_AEGTS
TTSATGSAVFKLAAGPRFASLLQSIIPSPKVINPSRTRLPPPQLLLSSAHRIAPGVT